MKFSRASCRISGVAIRSVASNGFRRDDSKLFRPAASVFLENFFGKLIESSRRDIPVVLSKPVAKRREFFTREFFDFSFDCFDLRHAG